jgi:hypothetical protein
MRWIALIVTGLCGITLGYTARAPEALSVAQPPIAATSHKMQRVVIEPIATAEAPAGRSFDSSRRNLFTFVQPEQRPVTAIKPRLPQTVVAESKPAATVEAEVPREPEFGFRYVGTFGHAHDPIAVFVHDGKILNARTGESVGSFRVDRVGFDAVSVRSPGTNRVSTLPNGR